MNLRTRKRLLNLLSFICLLTSVAVTVRVYTASSPIDNVDLKSGDIAGGQVSTASPESRQQLVPDEDHWAKKWRRPLYDPPPVKEVVIVAPPRPVTFTLTGTAIDAQNSQAFLRLSSGEIVLRQIGEPITADPLDGKISKITATGISVARETDEIELSVETGN